MHKHNLTIKVLTSLRSNLQTHRAKLKSDTDERLKYYDGYVVALKARTDQEFAAILEHLGVKTDEHIGETLAAMQRPTLVSATRQDRRIQQPPKGTPDVDWIFKSKPGGS